MLVDKQSELMSDLLFTVHQHGGDDVTWKPPIKLAADKLKKKNNNNNNNNNNKQNLVTRALTFLNYDVGTSKLFENLNWKNPST